MFNMTTLSANPTELQPKPGTKKEFGAKIKYVAMRLIIMIIEPIKEYGLVSSLE